LALRLPAHGAEDLDLVIHLGDYIYESSWGRNHVRKHNAGEPTTLEEYRNRYALYKSDADLKSAHAAFPWIVTWDDHEVQNDYADDRSQFLDPVEAFLERRTAAYRAYYEHMPLPASMRPRGREMRIHTRAEFGALAALHVLDDRQCRSHQVARAKAVAAAACVRRPASQGSGIRRSAPRRSGGWPRTVGVGRWNVIAQQIMAQVDRKVGEGAGVLDRWLGRLPQARESCSRRSRAARGEPRRDRRRRARMRRRRPQAQLRLRPPGRGDRVRGGSITSQGPSAAAEGWRAENPHIHFCQRHPAQLHHDGADAALPSMRAVAHRRSRTRARWQWTVEDGTRAQRAWALSRRVRLQVIASWRAGRK
jgi:alkaline phosphatase D